MPTTSLKDSLETSQPRLLDDQSKVMVPLTLAELRDLCNERIRLPVLHKFERALGLIEYASKRKEIIEGAPKR